MTPPLFVTLRLHVVQVDVPVASRAVEDGAENGQLLTALIIACERDGVSAGIWRIDLLQLDCGVTA